MKLNKNFFETKGKYQYQQVFGIKKEQSSILFEVFKATYLEEVDIQYANRQAIYAPYKNMTARKKIIKDEALNNYLHIMLYYIRHYPTLEELGWQLGCYKQQASKILSDWLIILIKSLRSCKVVPARDLEELEQVTDYLLGEGVLKEEDLDLIIDVTERRVNRPVDNDTQKELYSGKKNATR